MSHHISRAENDAWAAEAIYKERGAGVIRREPVAHQAGRLDGAMEGRKEGWREVGGGRERRRREEGSVVVEAWLQGVSMAGLPKNL